MEIEPIAGRLVLFDSVAVEHEVLYSFRPRMAVTLWANGVNLHEHQAALARADAAKRAAAGGRMFVRR